MNIKEITALRKSGNLDAALAAAKTEFDNNANKYTASAYFWCLNDLYRTQPHDDALSSVELMKSLFDDHCSDDEYMPKALASAQTSLLPHYQEVKDALSKAKQDGASDILGISQSIFKLFEAGEIDKNLYPDLGWLCYHTLKHTPTDDARNRKIMLKNYLNLDLPKPSSLHSRILGEAIKVEQNTPLQFRIRDFVRLWGIENLTDDDWTQPKSKEGHLLPSVVEKLIGVYAKEVKTDCVSASEEFSQLIDTALERFPGSQNLPYFKALILISQDKRAEAVGYYRDLILRFPSKFYLWEQISELTDDIDIKIGCLSKALTTGDDESFLGGVRLKMARHLIAKGMTDYAKCELEKYRNLYQSKGWKLKHEYHDLCLQLPAATSVNDNQELYSQYSVKADEYIYDSLPNIVAIKVHEAMLDDRNHPGRRFLQWTLRTKDATLRLKKPQKFNLDKRTPNGAIFNAKVHNGKIVWIKASTNAIAEDWAKELSGTVASRIGKNGKRYTFIQGVYVGENLLKGISDGDNIKVIAIIQDDGRWSAISSTKI